MNKDRIDGAVSQIKGTAKVVVGNVTGDAKLTAEGKIDKAKGAAQNAIGGLKEAISEAEKS